MIQDNIFNHRSETAMVNLQACALKDLGQIKLLDAIGGTLKEAVRTMRPALEVYAVVQDIVDNAPEAAACFFLDQPGAVKKFVDSYYKHNITPCLQKADLPQEEQDWQYVGKEVIARRLKSKKQHPINLVKGACEWDSKYEVTERACDVSNPGEFLFRQHSEWQLEQTEGFWFFAGGLGLKNGDYLACQDPEGRTHLFGR